LVGVNPLAGLAGRKAALLKEDAMSQAYVVTGELTDSRHVSLDEPVPLAAGKVRVIFQELPPEPKPDLKTFLEQMWERQQARGHVPRTKEEIDSYLEAERDSWDR
jgi:hypothetical protein